MKPLTQEKKEQLPAIGLMRETPESLDAKIIAGADLFRVAIFIGRGQYDRFTAASFEEAKIVAGNMEDYYKATGRKAIIYAIDRQNRSTIIPEKVWRS